MCVCVCSVYMPHVYSIAAICLLWLISIETVFDYFCCFCARRFVTVDKLDGYGDEAMLKQNSVYKVTRTRYPIGRIPGVRILCAT